MTTGECGAMLAIAGRLYGKQVNTALVEAWQVFMADVDPEDGAMAMRQHITESPHFPTVADIRKRIADRRVGALDAATAWAEVREAFSAVGSYRSPLWSHPALADAVDTIGWKVLCNTLDEDLPTVRAQFERYFNARMQSYQRAANSGQLEAYRAGPVVRIGPKSTGDVMKLIQDRIKKEEDPQMTHGECGLVVNAALLAYGKTGSDQLVDMWWEFLNEVAFEEGMEAMRGHIGESKYFPTVAGILERVGRDRVRILASLYEDEAGK